MAKIKIDQLEVNNSELKDLNYWETQQIVGGLTQISGKDRLNQAIKDALTRRDIAQNSNPK